MIRHSCLPLFCVILIAAECAAQDPAQTALKELMGAWELAYSEANRERVEVGTGITLRLDVKGDQWIETSRGKGAGGFRATFKIDASRTPKAIDLTVKKGEEEARWRGIYKVDGSVLTVYRTRIEDRPKHFESNDEGTVFVFVYRRIENPTLSESRPSKTYTLAVAKDNSVSVGGGTVSVERLTAKLAELGGTRSDAIVIKARRGTPYAVVVAILDELAKAGYAKVSLATTSE